MSIGASTEFWYAGCAFALLMSERTAGENGAVMGML